ncbi:MAG: dUTP diphosphatase [Phycisphaeraceae bacterium]|nr:dUTP diphosphatase [Phycisphaeraceae bacterium]
MPDTLQVAITRLPGHDDIALPAYQSQHAAGMDVHAAVPADAPLVLEPGRHAMVPTGFALAVPEGYEAQVRPRSGLAAKHGVTALNSPGTIDADYRGHVQILLINHGRDPLTITRGMRIAQLVIKPVPRVAWLEVRELPATARGEGGFGHTGA